MENKIGILTYHSSDNYGAVLQCYALQNYLTSNNYDAEIINYRTTRPSLISILSLTKNHVLYVMKNFSFNSFFIYTRQYKALFKQKAKFEYFRSRFLKMSKLYDTVSENHDFSNYDIIITGSDQIWNSINGYFKSYFLIGFDKYNGKRISYAACRGIKEVPENDLKPLHKALNDYDWIGVRDQQTKEFVYTCSGNRAEIVCDPSMLIDYSSLINKESKYNFKYIFVYILGKEINGGHINIIKELKKKHPGIKLIASYLTKKNPKHFDWIDINIYDAGPIEWLNLIKFSEFFYTDSFHGVLFALKLKKDFIGFYSEEKRASRLIDISKRLKIEDRIINSCEDAHKKNSFGKINNYDEISNKYNEFIENSKLLLNSTLSNLKINKSNL